MTRFQFLASLVAAPLSLLFGKPTAAEARSTLTEQFSDYVSAYEGRFPDGYKLTRQSFIISANEDHVEIHLTAVRNPLPE